MAAETIPEQEARALCALTKTADVSIWKLDEDKPGSMSHAIGVVCNPARRGLLVEVIINRGSKAKRRTINFGLWDTSTSGHVRVYQLTVADAASPTHNEQGQLWFGSHEHMGDKATHLPELDTMSFEQAFARFLVTVNLTLEGSLDDPTDPDKFVLK